MRALVFMLLITHSPQVRVSVKQVIDGFDFDKQFSGVTGTVHVDPHGCTGPFQVCCSRFVSLLALTPLLGIHEPQSQRGQLGLSQS